MTLEEKVKLITERLLRVYPNPKCALVHDNPLQLLIATILSAQCTDKLVNLVTPELFKRYKNVHDFAESDLEELDTYIVRVNFHRNKAKSIQGACKMIVEKFEGEVPKNMEDLDSLPGVARKTANVVLGDAFNTPEGIVVDTHVNRLSNKLGLTKNSDPVKIEQDLMKIVPKKDWVKFSHLLILHGRDLCTARPHTCENCPLFDLCPDAKK